MVGSLIEDSFHFRLQRTFVFRSLRLQLLDCFLR